MEELTFRTHNDIILYVHLPFCVKKCDYCDFYSEAGVGDTTIDTVLELILSDARRMLILLGNPLVKTIYVGGGTPSMVPPGKLGAFLAALVRAVREYARLEAGFEFSIEANPESLKAAFLDAVAKAGVNRLSLGMQSVNDAHLELIGRPGKAAQVHAALELSRREWKGRLSVDVVFGYPGQRRAQMEADLDCAVQSGAGHISLYALTVEPGTPLHRAVLDGRVPEQKPDTQLKLWRQARDVLSGQGFMAYELSNHARPGEECRHNQGYWTMMPWLGLGPGAVSKLAGTIGPVHLQGGPLKVWKRGVTIEKRYLVEQETPNDLVKYALMSALRTARGISSAELAGRYGWFYAQELVKTFLARPGGSPLGDYQALMSGVLLLKWRGWELLDGLLRKCFDVVDEFPVDQRGTWPD